MDQTMSAGRQARPANPAPPGSKGAGGVFGTLKTYIATQGAAIRTSDAVDGHNRPAERDLRELGIDHSPAYSAVVRH
jgi:hypothetical protein